jgi:hypothetical protein
MRGAAGSSVWLAEHDAMTTSVEKLVTEFAEKSQRRPMPSATEIQKTGNKHAKRYIRAVGALQKLGNQGRQALVPLLSDRRDDVRAMAAAFLLRYRHREARGVLEELARGKGFVAFSATETLKRWDEGTWQLDPL